VEFIKTVRNGDRVEMYVYKKCPMSFPYRRQGPKKPRGFFGFRREDHLKAMRRRFVRMCWRVFDNQKTNPALLTLTFSNHITSVPMAYMRFKEGMRRIKFEYPNLEYIAVPEFTKKGRVHFHLIVWGIPEWHVASERDYRRIATMWGLGFIDIVPTNGSKKLISYVSKYFVKASADPRLVNQKAYTRSRSMNLVGETITWSYNQTVSPVDNWDSIIFTVAYDTKYLGRGTYYLFQANQFTL